MLLAPERISPNRCPSGPAAHEARWLARDGKALRVLAPRPVPVKLTKAPGERESAPSVSVEVLPEPAWLVQMVELPARFNSPIVWLKVLLDEPSLLKLSVPPDRFTAALLAPHWRCRS